MAEKARTWHERASKLKKSVALRRKALQLIETIVLGHFPGLTPTELAAMLKIKDIRKTRFYQEVLEKGREAEREEIASRLLARNLPAAEVAALTGLSVRRVRSLVKKNGKPRHR